MEKKHDWLFDDITKLRQKIRFKNRIVYKVAGELHNQTGPAVIFLNSDKDSEYFLKGVRHTSEEWELKIRGVKIKKILKKCKAKKTEIE